LNRNIRRILAAGVFLALGACQNMTAKAIRTAARAGLSAQLVQGDAYKHQIFAGLLVAGEPLYVFIEGDGSPWRNNGSRVSNDPTPHQPLALRLAARTPRSVIYLGRPCYFQAISDSACTPPAWTSGRYSENVVASMAAALNGYIDRVHPGGVVLVGYSGGGVLAVLLAPLVPSTSAVVTIASDLDIDAWVRWHRYLPLTGSVNPAAQPPLPAAVQEWHLVGDRDEVVPPRLSQRYLDRVSADHVWHYPAFGHVCCWEKQWPGIFARIEAALRETHMR
jgi:pimeloyl-ACP methyl ester carboxylesterase